MNQNLLLPNHTQQQTTQNQIQQWQRKDGIVRGEIRQRQAERQQIQRQCEQLDREIIRLRYMKQLQKQYDFKQQVEQQEAIVQKYLMRIERNRVRIEEKQNKLLRKKAQKEQMDRVHEVSMSELIANVDKQFRIYQLQQIIVEKQKLTKALYHVLAQYNTP